MGGADDARRVAENVLGDRHFADDALRGEHLGGVGHRLQARRRLTRRAPGDLEQVRLTGKRHEDLEEEAIQLGLG